MAPGGGVVIQRFQLTPGCIVHRDLRVGDDGGYYVHDADVQDHRGVSCWAQLSDELADWLGERLHDIDAFGGRQFVAGRLELIEESRVADEPVPYVLAGGM